MPKKAAFWIQFASTVLGTAGAVYTQSEDIFTAFLAALGAAGAMAQKSMNDPRRTAP